MSEPKWISVDERLPKERKQLLLTDGRQRFVGSLEGSLWCATPTYDRREIGDPTHWCDCLPELPGMD